MYVYQDGKACWKASKKHIARKFQHLKFEQKNYMQLKTQFRW